MDSLDLIGSILGLGFLAGIRLYSTVLALGIAIRLGWLPLPDSLRHLHVLADPVVLGIAGAMFLIELVADKVPWVDSVWDSFHTVIRPVGAALLAATALTGISPAFKIALVLLSGGVAFASHSSKAATRMVVNSSPEPVSNISLSLFGDLLVPLGLWIALRHPLLSMALVLLFLAAFAWLSASVFRLVRLQFTALAAWLGAPLPYRADPLPLAAPLLPAGAAVLAQLARQTTPIPRAFARALAEQGSGETPSDAVRCAATRSVGGLRNSIGYLALTPAGLAFVTRRSFRYRVHHIALPRILAAEFKQGLLLNRLVVQTADGERVFHLFKHLDIGRAQ